VENLAELSPDPLKAGAGGELLSDLILGYGLPVTVRFGLAYALTPGGIRPGDPSGLYFQLGAHF
jgi:hypothetical protein